MRCAEDSGEPMRYLRDVRLNWRHGVLERLYADNYRTLVGFCFEPPAFSVLIGDNGAGKTALYELLCGLQDVVVRGASVAEAFPTSTLTRWDTRSEQAVAIDLRDGDELFHYELALHHNREKAAVSIARESLEVGGAKLYESEAGEARLFGDPPQPEPRARIPFDRRRSFLSALEPRPDNKRLVRFRSLVERFWLFKLDPLGMGSVSKGESVWLERTGLNFPSWYRAFVQEGLASAELTSELRKVLPGFSALRSAPTGGESRELHAVFEDPNYELAFNELSDGQRALVVLYAVLHPPEGPALLVFDEPENYVALTEIQPWLAEVSKTVEQRGRQVILMSHHPEIIDYAAASAALRMYRARGGPAQVEPLDIDLDQGFRASEVVAMGRADERSAGPGEPR